MRLRIRIRLTRRLRLRGLPGVVSGEQQPVDSVPPPQLGRLGEEGSG